MRRSDRPLLGPGGLRGGSGDPEGPHHDGRRPRTLLAVLLLVSFIVITLDARNRDDSPVDAMRTAAAAVFGPLETAAATLSRPITSVTGYFGDVRDLRTANERLQGTNDRLRSRLRTGEFARQRSHELDRLLDLGRQRDDRLVAAQVTAMSAGQTFSRTVTIDAGRRDGVRPDMTVLNGDGLVGRVIAASSSSASVLLIIDADSVVGGRVGRSMELGFISGEGDIGERARLRMELVDRAADPGVGDTVVTWGSRNGAPYVAGVPIGSVSRVETSPRELSKTVVLQPYVDFSALDMVGVVVDADRPGRDDVRAGARGGRR
ncbi:MAG TPA: rod shape-determining protein MreC [Nocardioidaceae bacterium]|nr:rod shape-determining protein MreC [Nocardioidaceae bacterium]